MEKILGGIRGLGFCRYHITYRPEMYGQKNQRRNSNKMFVREVYLACGWWWGLDTRRNPWFE